MSSLLPFFAPYSGWALMLCLAVFGLWLTVRGLRVRADASRRCCPNCDYDLSHSPTTTCCECGRTLLSEREAQTPHRRPFVAILSLFIAIALPTFVIHMRIRHEGWDYYTRLYPIYWFSPDEILDEYHSGPYKIQIMRDRRRGYDGQRYEGCRAQICRGTEALWSFEEHYSIGGVSAYKEMPYSVDVQPIQDIDGDGIPEFVCVSDEGGNGGCSLTHIFRLGKTLENLNPHVPDQADDNIRQFVDLKHDGKLTLTGDDQTFAFWLTSHASSPYPKVAFRLRNNHIEPASDLMRTVNPPSTPEQLAKTAKECRDFRGDNSDDAFYSLLLSTMTDLIYSGHSPEAYAFLDQAWPGPESAKQEFLKGLRRHLADSPFRSTLEALGHPPLPTPSPPEPHKAP